MIKDRYNIIEKIGTGSYGEVYKCQDCKTKQSVAIKKLKFERKKLEEEVPFFEREISIMKKLNHKNIVRMVQQFQYKKEVYIVTQFCEKGDLLYYIRSKDLSKMEILRFYEQIVDGLVYIHEMNIMHRDLKPQNIFISKDQIIKIGDFGMCKLGTDLMNTEQVGTPMYSAPNIMQSQGNYTLKCDVFSVGLLLWFMIKKSHFFESARNVFQLRQQHQQKLKKILIGKTIEKLDCDQDFKIILQKTLVFEQKYRISAKQLQNLVTEIRAKNNIKKPIKKKNNKEQGKNLDKSTIISKIQNEQPPRKIDKLAIINQNKNFLKDSKNLFQKNKQKYLQPLLELECLKTTYPLEKINKYIVIFLKIAIFNADTTLLLEKLKDQYDNDRSLYLGQIEEFLKECNNECIKLVRIIKSDTNYNSSIIERNKLNKILKQYAQDEGSLSKLDQLKSLFKNFFLKECQLPSVKLDNQIRSLYTKLKGD